MSEKKTPGHIGKPAAGKASSTPDIAALENALPNAMTANTSSGDNGGVVDPAVGARVASYAVTPVGPPTNALKEAFSAQKIPLQTDFSNLIDVADCGRKAVGLSPGQSGPGAGLQLDDATGLLSINDGFGLQVAGNKLEVNRGAGLTSGTDGSVAVATGSGVMINPQNQVCVDPNTVLPPGVIVMFSGTVIPQGWALCDGGGGRPDLRNRFILGGSGAEIGNAGGSALSGTGSSKSYNVGTNAVSAGKIDVTIAATVLTINQMPSHSHVLEVGWTNNGWDGWTVVNMANTHQKEQRLSTYSAGSSEPHTHNGSTASQGTHSHTINSLPAYYILAFIIKL
ncbi:phage tail protein [Dyella choica]|uniref:Tail fiber protein n=1 Tax=Dyella choica TaxID=1927959 RepID=A0A432MAL0_9GAMM|nr:phage tail protein [Dyella choica]RUL78802.1 tail fiber protein [Dyella choica]